MQLVPMVFPFFPPAAALTRAVQFPDLTQFAPSAKPPTFFSSIAACQKHSVILWIMKKHSFLPAAPSDRPAFCQFSFKWKVPMTGS